MWIEIRASARFGSGKKALRIFECWENEGHKKIGSKYVNVALLQEKGVIKTMNQTKKATEFLNSEEGLKFYKETPHTRLPI